MVQAAHTLAQPLAHGFQAMPRVTKVYQLQEDTLAQAAPKGSDAFSKEIPAPR